MVALNSRCHGCGKFMLEKPKKIVVTDMENNVLKECDTVDEAVMFALACTEKQVNFVQNTKGEPIISDERLEK